VSARLRVLVVDDELLARRRLLRLLSAMPEVVCAGECESAEELLARLGTGPAVDVVLLDIHMTGLSGIEAGHLLPSAAPQVIYCTADPDFALPAFDVGALDYLLKPIEALRLKQALSRARQRIAAVPAEPARARATERLAISTGKGICLLEPSEVSHATLDGPLVTISTAAGCFYTDLGLSALHEKLAAAGFERVHRRALVNLAHVTRLDPTDGGGYLASMRNGQVVEVSRQCARALRRRLYLL
jgi:two-component system LytT family response regulator